MDEPAFNDPSFNALQYLNEKLKKQPLVSVRSQLEQLQQNLRFEQQSERRQQVKQISEALVRTATVANRLLEQSKMVEKQLSGYEQSRLQTLQVAAGLTQLSTIKNQQDQKKNSVSLVEDTLNLFVTEHKYLAACAIIHLIRQNNININTSQMSKELIAQACSAYFDSTRFLNTKLINYDFALTGDPTHFVDQHAILMIGRLTSLFSESAQYGVDEAIQLMKQLQQDLDERDALLFVLNYFDAFDQFAQSHIGDTFDDILKTVAKMRQYQKIAEKFKFPNYSKVRLQIIKKLSDLVQQFLLARQEEIFSQQRRKFRTTGGSTLADLLQLLQQLEQPQKLLRQQGVAMDYLFEEFTKDSLKRVLQQQLADLQHSSGANTDKYFFVEKAKSLQNALREITSAEQNALFHGFKRAVGCYVASPSMQFKQESDGQLVFTDNVSRPMQIFTTKALQNPAQQLFWPLLPRLVQPQSKMPKTALYVISLAEADIELARALDQIAQPVLLTSSTVNVALDFASSLVKVMFSGSMMRAVVRGVNFATVIVPLYLQSIVQVLPECADKVARKFDQVVEMCGAQLVQLVGKEAQENAANQVGAEVAQMLSQMGQ